MANIILNNECGCWNPEMRGDKTCKECYFSQVNERNQWVGSQKCYNSGCLKYGGQK